MTLIEEIKPQQSIELLKHLHILTRDGKINQDSRRKLKQVYHLYQFIEPILKEINLINSNYFVVDHGAGKSYLGFILYDLFIKLTQGKILSIERNKELVFSSEQLAKKFNFERMQFVAADTNQANAFVKENVDIVTALHACDTATDDALHFGLKKEAAWIILIPCCQAEVAKLLKTHKSHSLQNPLAELWRHAIHTRELGGHLTNVLRCLLLESQGYQVTVTELVGWEHSMKNELIIAKKTQQIKGNAKARIEKILGEFNLPELKKKLIIKAWRKVLCN